MKKKQFSKDALSSFQDYVNPGSIEGIFLRFVGTNDTGSGEFGDLGEVTITRNGATQHQRPIEFYADLMNMRAGSAYLESVDGGDFEAVVFIPFYEFSFRQAYQVFGTNELNVSFRPSTDTTDQFTALECEVYTSLIDADEFYQYSILGNDQDISAQVASKPYQLADPNITNVWLEDIGGNLTDVALEQDGELAYTDQPVGMLEAETLYDNRLEVNNFDRLQLQLFTPRNQPSTRSNDTQLIMSTTGAGLVNVTYSSMDWN